MEPIIQQSKKRYLDLLRQAKIRTISPGELTFDGKYWRYTDLDCTSESGGIWDGEQYLRRLAERIVCQKNDPNQWEKSLSALDFWLDHDFLNPNWWHNQIGTPSNLAKVLLLCDGKLTPAQLEKGIAIVRRGSMSHNPDIANGWWTAANLIWGTANSLRTALLTDDEELLRRAVARTAQEIFVTPADASDGIKPDGGFFQHGPLLYSGGYGRSLVQELAEMAYLLSGTPLQFAPEKLDILATHILDGQRNLSHKAAFDYNATGREFTREGALYLGVEPMEPAEGCSADVLYLGRNKRTLLFALKLLVQVAEFPRKPELLAYIDEIEGRPTQYSTDKYFPVVHYLTHKRPEYYIGIRGNGQQIKCAEICNDENMLGYHLAGGGTLCFLETGEEYAKIIPAWDYSMLPGTTAYHESDEELLRRTDWETTYHFPGNPNESFGGAKDGVSALYLTRQKDGIFERTLVVCTDGGCFVMENSLTAENSGKPLHFTLNQCLADHPRTETGEEIAGKITLPSGKSVRNGGFTYRRLDEGELFALREERQGSWQRNCASATGDKFPCNLFAVGIDLGQEVRDGSFVLSVTHDSDRPEAWQITCRINTPQVTALEFSNGRGVVFLAEGETYTTTSGESFTAPGLHIF